MFDCSVHKSFSDFFTELRCKQAPNICEWGRQKAPVARVIRLSDYLVCSERRLGGMLNNRFSSLNVVYPAAGGRLSRGSAWRRVNSPQFNFRMQWELSPLEAFCNSTWVHNLVGLFKIMTRVRTTMQYCVIPHICVGCLLASQLQWGNYGIRWQK